MSSVPSFSSGSCLASLSSKTVFITSEMFTSNQDLFLRRRGLLTECLPGNVFIVFLILIVFVVGVVRMGRPWSHRRPLPGDRSGDLLSLICCSHSYSFTKAQLKYQGPYGVSLVPSTSQSSLTVSPTVHYLYRLPQEVPSLSTVKIIQ